MILGDTHDPETRIMILIDELDRTRGAVLGCGPSLVAGGQNCSTTQYRQ